MEIDNRYLRPVLKHAGEFKTQAEAEFARSVKHERRVYTALAADAKDIPKLARKTGLVLASAVVSLYMTVALWNQVESWWMACQYGYVSFILTFSLGRLVRLSAGLKDEVKKSLRNHFSALDDSDYKDFGLLGFSWSFLVKVRLLLLLPPILVLTALYVYSSGPLHEQISRVSVAAVFCGLFYWIVTSPNIPSSRDRKIAAVSLAAFCCWLLYSGLDQLRAPRYSLGQVVSLSVGLVLWVLTWWKIPSLRRRRVRAVWLATLSCWLVYSVLDLARERYFGDWGSEVRAQAAASPAPSPGIRVGVALSGGGYRAALMHSGVLAELDRLGFPATHLSTVSGGSIIGTYYATGRPPAQFPDAVVQGRLSLVRRLGNTFNALRLPAPLRLSLGPRWISNIRLFPWYEFDRTDVLANVFDSVFLDGMTLEQFEAARGEKIRLQLCATDLRSGYAVGISPDRTILRGIPRPVRQELRDDNRIILYEPHLESIEYEKALLEVSLARLVAASGAFPGAFNSVPIELSAAGKQPRMLDLGDGGLSDNLGVRLLLDRLKLGRDEGSDDWQLDLLIVSDGGAPVLERTEGVHPSALHQVPRAIDIVYAGSGWHHLAEEVGRVELPPTFFLRPSAARACPEASQYTDEFFRTGTLEDNFDRSTANALFELGRALVRCAARSAEWPRVSNLG